MPITSLDLVPPWMSPEQLHGSYMGSILEMPGSVEETIPMMEKLFTLLGAPPAA